MSASSKGRRHVLLTDLDGVLRHWDPAYQRAAERAGGLPRDAVRNAAFAPDLLLPAVRGEVSDDAWRANVVERLQQTHPACDAAAAVATWSEPVGRIDPDVAALLQRVRSRHVVVLVTNATTRLAQDLTAVGAQDAFDHIINSADVGCEKPRPAIYQAALRAAGVEAASAVFVDDTEANVRGAQQLGLAGHLFQGAAGMQAFLQHHGLG